MIYLVLLLTIVQSGYCHDWLIVPGERGGPITAKSIESSLRAAIGAGAVVAPPIQIDGKTWVPGVEIRPGKPRESTGADCKWWTAAGVRVGVTFRELEKLNGKPFMLYPSPEWQA